MSKAEKFLEEHTRNCSNLLYRDYIGGFDKTVYQPWLTPEEARKVANIAREETTKEVCEWLDNHTMLSEKWYIEDLKKHLKGKRNDIRRH